MTKLRLNALVGLLFVFMPFIGGCGGVIISGDGGGPYAWFDGIRYPVYYVNGYYIDGYYDDGYYVDGYYSDGDWTSDYCLDFDCGDVEYYAEGWIDGGVYNAYYFPADENCIDCKGRDERRARAAAEMARIEQETGVPLTWGTRSGQ